MYELEKIGTIGFKLKRSNLCKREAKDARMPVYASKNTVKTGYIILSYIELKRCSIVTIMVVTNGLCTGGNFNLSTRCDGMSCH